MTIIEKRKSWLFIGSLSFITLAINGVQGFAHVSQNSRSYHADFGQQQRTIAPQIAPQSVAETPTSSYAPAPSRFQEQRTAFVVPQERPFVPQSTSFEVERPVSVTDSDWQPEKMPRVREVKQQPPPTVDKMFQKEGQASVTNVTPTMQALSHQTNSTISTDESKTGHERIEQAGERAPLQTNIQSRATELASKKENVPDPKREDRPNRASNPTLARGKAFQQSSSMSKPVATEPKVKTDVPKTAAVRDTTPSPARTFVQKIFSPPQEQPSGQSPSQPQQSQPNRRSENSDRNTMQADPNNSPKPLRQSQVNNSNQQPKAPKENSSQQSSSDNSSQPKRKK